MSQRQFDELITGLYQQFQEQASVVKVIPRTVQREIDHRLLTFKNSQGWLDYNEQFGEGDIYATMMHHLEGMAHDTALLEILLDRGRTGQWKRCTPWPSRQRRHI